MGLKIRAGMAVGGFALSYFFGITFLSGIASHLDTTGNILVDIADGIGLVSKGIEALESYIDPSKVPEVNQVTDPALPEVTIQAPDVQTATPAPAATPPKPVICKKGKCAPYDPTKDRVLQQQLIRAERERILQQFQTGVLPAESLGPAALLFDEDELDDDEVGNVVAKRLRAAAAAQQQKDKYKSGKGIDRK